MDTSRFETICDVMAQAERQAAELMLHAGAILEESKSSSRDLVTQYDKKIQELVTELILRQIPDAVFFGEEEGCRAPVDADCLFIIDPIDGTMNFVHHMSCSCISIACASGGTVCAGAVYNPYLDEMFTAVRGRGAFLNGRPISVFDGSLSEGIACLGTSPYYPELADGTFAIAKDLYLRCLDIRRGGSAALDLCSVAAGRAVIYAEQRISLWDYAAGMLIVEEAGGVCRTLDGSLLPLSGTPTSCVAAGQKAFDEFFI